MKIIAIALISSLLASSSALASSAVAATAAKVEQESVAWRNVAEAISLGTTVKVQTIDGKRIKGTLMRVDDQAISIKKNARIPEAATLVAYERISNMERDHSGGFGWGKAIGFGVAAGAGAILTILAIALQLD